MNGTQPDWDVVVIGAGAAGLLAAARAAEVHASQGDGSRRVLLLEKNRKPGVKILMSGGTRCNITQNTDRRGIVTAFGKQGSFLHSPLAALGPRELIELFESEGVATKVEETGKIFPVSDKALDVQLALLRRLERSGAQLALEEPVQTLQWQGEQFRIVTDRRTLIASRVILTSGGQSYPGCGTTGDGFAWAAGLGHTIVPPRPALVPLTTSAAWVPGLRGITLPDVGVRIVERGAIAVDKASRSKSRDRDHRGSFLFTHFGVSGPVVLDVSRDVTAHAHPASLDLVCDFLPNQTENELAEALQQSWVAGGGKKSIVSLPPADFPRRFWETLLALAEVPPEQRTAEASRAARDRLVRAIKRQSIPLSGTRGFAQAEVTAGGVALDEVDSRTMQSKKVPGLYLAGEVLDLDGPIGGYNFQAAFSTGWLAGQSV
jgi:hypothetical protein